MSYTSLRRVLDELSLLGLSDVPDRIKSGDQDFYLMVEPTNAVISVRHLLYSLLHQLAGELQWSYRISIKRNIIRLTRKAPIIPMITAQSEQPDTFRTFKGQVIESPELGAEPVNLVDILPTEESLAEEEDLMKILEG